MPRPPANPLNASERVERLSSSRAFSSTFVYICAAVRREDVSLGGVGGD